MNLKQRFSNFYISGLEAQYFDFNIRMFVHSFDGKSKSFASTLEFTHKSNCYDVLINPFFLNKKLNFLVRIARIPENNLIN